ncbi:50S ribosomal protein L10 [Leuconostocaceae bacterium ESL0958]|nr:50S ribosomal protein L10 [Leuconostocaceae bacterium ESL0958]
MSEQAIALKAKKVAEVAEHLKGSTAAVVVNPRGLTVAESNDLRSQLRQEGVLLEVIKNKVMVRAAEEAGYAEMNDLFAGPTAVAFSKDDAVAPAKVLKKFADNTEALEIKGGVIDGTIVSVDEINKYASLPSFDGLLGQLMAEFQYPIRSFAYAVKALQEKKEAEEGESAAAAE